MLLEALKSKEHQKLGPETRLMIDWLVAYTPTTEAETYSKPLTIDFFEHSANLLDLIQWTDSHFQEMRENRKLLLEFNDFPIPQKWVKQIHREFRQLQVRIPPSNAWGDVYNQINTVTPANSRDVAAFVNFGPGVMEFEARYAKETPGVWFGVDLSSTALEIAAKNLQGRVRCEQPDTISPKTVDNLKSSVRETGQSVCVLVNNSIEKFLSHMNAMQIEIRALYAMRSFHHIPNEIQEYMYAQKVDRFVEMDDICPDKPDVKIKAFTTLCWSFYGPLLANGLIFSILRDKSEIEVRDTADRLGAQAIIKNGMYLIVK